MQAGESPLNTIHPSAVTHEQVAQRRKLLSGWWRIYATHPPCLVITVDLELIASMDKDLDRVGLVSGGSIYPLAWNILLAARNEGYGGTMTTWGVAEGGGSEDAARHTPRTGRWRRSCRLGKPAKQLTKLKRKPVEDILYTDNWNGASD